MNDSQQRVVGTAGTRALVGTGVLHEIPSTGAPRPERFGCPRERRLRPVDSGRLKRSSPSATVGLSLAALGSLGLVVAAAYIHVYTQTINGLSLVFVHQTTTEYYGAIALVPVS